MFTVVESKSRACWVILSTFLKNYLFIYLLIYGCAGSLLLLLWLSLVVVSGAALHCWLLIALASLVAEHGL